MADKTTGQPRRFELWVLVAAILASSMAFIDGSALNVALPALQEDLGATGSEVLWIVNGYLLMLASLILVGGSLGDLYGRRRVFAVGIGLFTAASSACGLAPTTGVLIVARVVQGLGAALMVPGSLAIISAAFPPERRGQAIGTWSAFSTITTIGGPVIGGFLAQAGLWRFVFFINLPLGAIALYALLTYVPESRNEQAPRGLDIRGALLNVVALGAMTFGFIELGRLGIADGLQSPVVLASLAAGVIGLVVFVLAEAKSAHPMVPLGLFRSRTFSGVNLMTLFLYAGLTGVFFFTSLNLIQIQGYSESFAGLTFIPFTILLALLSRWSGGLIARYGPRLPLTVGPSIVGVSFILLALPGKTAGESAFFTTYFPAIVLSGIGMGVTVAPLTTAVMGAVSTSYSGVASGVSNAITRTAQVLATAIFGAIMLVMFSGSLTAQVDTLDLSDAQRATVLAEAQKLGGAQVPDTLVAAQADAVQAAYDAAFIAGYRVVAVVSAILAWISAIIAWLWLENRLVPLDDAVIQNQQADALEGTVL